ncbi:MAG: roadblock/LC7 domain-containing protein [Methanosarcinales archaeon]|nr:roadblock/LC7 domain-containing protein [Methanosarcinales archaeon]
MVRTKTDMLKKVLDGLESTGFVDASIIVSCDGLPMSSNVPEDVTEESLAAIAAAMFKSSDSAIIRLQRQKTDLIIIRCLEGNIVFMAAGDDAILGGMTGSDAGLGLLLAEMESAVEKVIKILKIE